MYAPLLQLAFRPSDLTGKAAASATFPFATALPALGLDAAGVSASSAVLPGAAIPSSTTPQPASANLPSPSGQTLSINSVIVVAVVVPVVTLALFIFLFIFIRRRRRRLNHHREDDAKPELGGDGAKAELDHGRRRPELSAREAPQELDREAAELPAEDLTQRLNATDP